MQAKLSEKLYASVKAFIDENYIETHFISQQRADVSVMPVMPRMICEESCELLQSEQINVPIIAKINTQSERQTQKYNLNVIVERLEETFSERLFRLIDENAGKYNSDSEVYKRANIDRRLFSKIRSNKDYQPSKNTALALAIALELSLDDARDLLMKAGFALSRSNKLDVIIEYFITEKNYNISEINEVLFAFEQSLLGA